MEVPDRPASTPRYRDVVQRADRIAVERGHPYVGVEHLLLAIIEENSSMAAVALQNTSCTERVQSELHALMSASKRD